MCKLFINVGYCCRHIFAIVVPISQKCFHVRCWNNYCFYYLRDDTPPQVNESFSRLHNVKKVISPLIPFLGTYPSFNTNNISMETFNYILSSPKPIIKNWPQDLIDMALQMDSDANYAGMGLSQETNFIQGSNYF